MVVFRGQKKLCGRQDDEGSPGGCWFGEVKTWLREEPTQFDSMDELARFLKTVVLGHHLERPPESEREYFAAIVAARLAQRGALVVDYLRLNILAKREVTA
jgi:trans-aconitate 2-methyltransferase